MADVIGDDGGLLDAGLRAAVGHLRAAGVAAGLGGVLEIGYVEVEIAHGDVFDHGPVLGGHDEAPLAPALHVAELDVAHVPEAGVLLAVFLDVEVDGAVDPVGAHAVAGDVIEGHVFDRALLPHDDGQHAVAVNDGAVAENDVADVEVRLGPQCESPAVGFHHAVGDDDVLAGAGLAAGLDDDGVVPAVEAAVGDEDVAAAVDIETVGIGAEKVVLDGDAVDGDMIAAEGVHRPPRRVPDGDAAKGKMPAAPELEQRADPLLDAFLIGPVPEKTTLLQRRLPEGRAPPVNHARPDDPAALRVLRPDQVVASHVPVFHVHAAHGVMGKVRVRLQSGACRQLQHHPAL